MPAPRGDRRSSSAIGMYWASRISNIGFLFALPPLVGWWLDDRWGTAPWLLIAAAGFGFMAGMLSILKLAGSFERRTVRGRAAADSRSESDSISPADDPRP